MWWVNMISKKFFWSTSLLSINHSMLSTILCRVFSISWDNPLVQTNQLSFFQSYWYGYIDFLNAKPWWDIDIHGWYSLVKIAFAPVCACKNNRQIWRHNVSASRSRDVKDQLWWRHNVKSEKTVPGDNGEMSNQWLFVAERCVQDKIACKK